MNKIDRKIWFKMSLNHRGIRGGWSNYLTNSERVWRHRSALSTLKQLTFNPRPSETMWSLGSEYASAAWKALRVLVSLSWLSVIWVCVFVCVRLAHKREGPLINRLTRPEGWVSPHTATEVHERDSLTRPPPHQMESSTTRLRLNNQEEKWEGKSATCTLSHILQLLFLCVLTTEKSPCFHHFLWSRGWEESVHQTPGMTPVDPKCRCLRQAGRRPLRLRSHKNRRSEFFNLLIYFRPTRLHAAKSE